MADSNDDKTATSDSDISDADLLASALEAGGHIPPGSEGSDDVGEVDPDDTDEVTEETTEDQPSGENAEEEAEAGEPEPEGDEGTGEETKEAEEPPKGIRDMQKRIDKITAKSKGLEEENATLKRQLETAQPIKLTATADDPLADLNTEQEVQERVDQMILLSRWCYENLDGGEAKNPAGEMIEYSSREVRQKLAAAQEMLGVHAPARRKYLQLRSQADNLARAAYPALWDASSRESRIANQFLHQCPAIMRAPNYQVIIGDAIRGMDMRLAEERAAKQKPKNEQKIAPRAVKPSQPAQKVASKVNGNPKLERRIRDGGSISTSELAELLSH